MWGQKLLRYGGGMSAADIQDGIKLFDYINVFDIMIPMVLKFINICNVNISRTTKPN